MYGHTNPIIRTTDEGETVGPKMHEAVTASAHEPWRSMKVLAEHVGPRGSTDFGYRIVHRCIRKGLISRPDPDHRKANPHGEGAVYVTEKGKRYLKNVDK